MEHIVERNSGLGGPEEKWEGETKVVARDETQKVLCVRPIHTLHFNFNFFFLKSHKFDSQISQV
jgi:hypothetical protein